MNTTSEIFRYLNSMGLADQVHYRDGGQIVFYHWNKTMTDLVASLTLENGRIERMYYPRKVMPKIYLISARVIEDNFQGEDFIRDYRSK